MARKSFRINGFRNIINLPKVDTFDGRTYDDAFVGVYVHQAADGQKFFVVGDIWTVFGYTSAASAAFRVLGDAPTYTREELLRYVRSH